MKRLMAGTARAAVANTDPRPCRGACGLCSPGLLLLIVCLGRTAAAAPALIEFQGSHAGPSYVVRHIDWIESRPFDGMVINDFLGRNLLCTNLRELAPQAVGPNGAVTYDASAQGLAALKGVFRKFHHNFAKVNFALNGPPPLLTDEAGWQVVYEGAAHYARAVQAAGLEGIFFDNENYLRPTVAGHAADYWRYEDQLTLAGTTPRAMPLPAALELAAKRGRELMQAFERGFAGLALIVAHGPYEGCDAWRGVLGHYGNDRYLLGAFAAGMVAGTSSPATFVDGGEDYDLRSPWDFATARAWRNGSQGGITSLGSSRCPFMDASLAATWQQKVSIAFATFDKERPSVRIAQWTPITDVAAFRNTLTNALRSSDRYVWHYAEWQDWWGNTTEDALRPWISAIEAARRDAGLDRQP
jgi:hypothetical protein